jgi:hypothetical protein
MTKQIPVPGDPDHTMYLKAKRWDDRMRCMPTWDEILEYEYVRQRGEINMLYGLSRYAFDRGLYALFEWIGRCSDHDMSLWDIYGDGLALHEKEHGPRASWVTGLIKVKFLEREFSLKRDDLDRQQRELEMQISQLKTHNE